MKATKEMKAIRAKVTAVLPHETIHALVERGGVEAYAVSAEDVQLYTSGFVPIWMHGDGVPEKSEKFEGKQRAAKSFKSANLNFRSFPAAATAA